MEKGKSKTQNDILTYLYIHATFFQTWTDIKISVKKQYNEIRKFTQKTGGGSWNDKDAPPKLSEIDNIVLSIITVHAVEGDGQTPEAGCNVHEVSTYNTYKNIFLNKCSIDLFVLSFIRKNRSQVHQVFPQNNKKQLHSHQKEKRWIRRVSLL